MGKGLDEYHFLLVFHRQIQLLYVTCVRFFITPKPTDVDEHLKPSTRAYHQEWRLVHLFYIHIGAAVIPCGGCTDTPP